ncbi:ribonuclease H-like domain-containing protein [Tanacetum coccineum]
MTDEYNALINNNTWTLVPRPTDANIICCMWLFRHKYLADGTLSCYKACLIANGSTQLDVKNAFLDGDLSKTVYMNQPPGFKDSTHPDYVCLLKRSLYGLKQDSRAYFQHMGLALLICYYMWMILFSQLPLSRCYNASFLLYILKYATEILEQARMVSCNPSRTPVDIESKLYDDGDPVSDPTLYRSFAGSLQYLTFTRPDISYAVRQVRVLHVPSRYQYADIFTKGLPSALFEEFRSSLSIRCPPLKLRESHYYTNWFFPR